MKMKYIILCIVATIVIMTIINIKMLEFVNVKYNSNIDMLQKRIETLHNKLNNLEQKQKSCSIKTDSLGSKLNTHIHYNDYMFDMYLFKKDKYYLSNKYGFWPEVYE